jgi:hypothetical protein
MWQLTLTGILRILHRVEGSICLPISIQRNVSDISTGNPAGSQWAFSVRFALRAFRRSTIRTYLSLPSFSFDIWEQANFKKIPWFFPFLHQETSIAKARLHFHFCDLLFLLGTRSLTSIYGHFVCMERRSFKPTRIATPENGPAAAMLIRS